MKNLNIKIPTKNISSYGFMLLALILIITLWSCSDDDCEYAEICEESCDIFEDFEEQNIGSSGNWQGIADAGVFFENRAGSTVLHANDGPGGSWAFNNVDFPSNFLLEGCALQFDIEYDAVSNDNGDSVSNIFSIYDGSSPNSNTILASFVLNSTNSIISGPGFTTVEIPIELGVGTTLPSNSFGSWVISGVTSPTSSDVDDFNNLLQNNSGVSFRLDSGGSPSEQYWYDNFCFKQCCPE